MHITTNNSNWSEDKIAKLRRLWEEGLPTAEIGRRLGITKNAVIGKAWRLDLPPAPRFGRPKPCRAAEISPATWPSEGREPPISGSAVNRSSPASPTAQPTVASAYVRPVSAALERDFL